MNHKKSKGMSLFFFCSDYVPDLQMVHVAFSVIGDEDYVFTAVVRASSCFLL